MRSEDRRVAQNFLLPAPSGECLFRPLSEEILARQRKREGGVSFFQLSHSLVSVCTDTYRRKSSRCAGLVRWGGDLQLIIVMAVHRHTPIFFLNVEVSC